MALSRKTLKAMGLTEEQVDSIIEAHTETVNGLKDDLARYKADAEKLAEVQHELDEAKTKLENDDVDGWKTKHDTVKAEFEAYKSEVEAAKTKEAKETAYRDILKGIGVSDKRIDSIVRVTDLSGIELDENGAIQNAENLAETAKTEWADFIEAQDATKAVRIDTGGSLSPGNAARTKDEILQIKDTSERQKAWADYLKTQKGS